MPGSVYLEGDGLTLNTVQPDDYGFVARHFNNPTIRHEGFQALRTPFYEDDIAAIVEEQNDYHLFLACREGEPVGCAFLLEIDLEGRNAELGYFIIPDEQGSGYATEAAELCLIHGFDELGLHKIWARTTAEN